MKTARLPGTDFACVLGQEMPGTGRQIVLLPTSLDMRGALELALERFPETARVVFWGGSSTRNRRKDRFVLRTWDFPTSGSTTNPG